MPSSKAAARTEAVSPPNPEASDRSRFQAVLETQASPGPLSESLARLLPTLETAELRQHALQLLARSYAEALRQGGAPSDLVERSLLETPGQTAESAVELAQACYVLARHGLRVSWLERCVLEVDRRSRDSPERARLAATVDVLRKRFHAALPELERAVAAFDLRHDPELYLRRALTFEALEKHDEACVIAGALYREHPLLPGLEILLPACGADFVSRLRDESQVALLAREQARPPLAPDLSLEDDALRPVEWPAQARGYVTVLAAFSTWCPHCGLELPRLNAFWDWLESHPPWKTRVRVLGLRTAVEREQVPYAEFLSRLKPQFPILTDSTWSLSFTQLVRQVGLRAELPLVLVLDEDGGVRFVLDSGPYKDTTRDLVWIVQALWTRQEGFRKTPAEAP